MAYGTLIDIARRGVVIEHHAVGRVYLRAEPNCIKYAELFRIDSDQEQELEPVIVSVDAELVVDARVNDIVHDVVKRMLATVVARRERVLDSEGGWG